MTHNSVLSLRLLAWGLVLSVVSPICAQEDFQTIPNGVRVKLGQTEVELTAPTAEICA
jgi:hypothetical protein